MFHAMVGRLCPVFARTALALLLASLLVLGGLSPAPAAASPHLQSGTIVRCDPSTVTGTIAQTLTVDLYVQDVSALYGIDLRTAFDSTIAQVVDEAPGTAGVQLQPLSTFLQPDYLARNVADNSAGTIRYAATQVNPTSPATGSGPVARIRFTALREGLFTMAFTYHELSDRDGVLIPNAAQGCTITFESPTAVTLAEFTATPQEGDNLIAWETASEIDTLGFNVYRSDSAAGGRTVLNDSLILAQTPGVERGASYSWLDRGCTLGTTVSYWLESVGLDGKVALHGPVSATCAGPTAVSVQELRVSRQTSVGLPAITILALVAFYDVRYWFRAH
jgi:hypothetical protein